MQTKISSLVSLDEYLEKGSESDIELTSEVLKQPENIIERQELKKMLVQALEALTENEKKVILLHYYEDLTSKEISQVLEVSESRISQLHTKALQKLRLRLGSQMDILFY